MKASMIHWLGPLVAGLLACLATPASAQLSATANGPYYATPSWDQRLTNNRFVILANWFNDAVLDRETGLVWERSPDTTRLNWTNAQFHCNDRSVGGRKGWRLPGAQELASLEDPTVASPGPTLPLGHPFVGVHSSPYWSATTSASDATAAWGVEFFNGVVTDFLKVGEHHVWCVRGGQGPDAQLVR